MPVVVAMGRGLTWSPRLSASAAWTAHRPRAVCLCPVTAIRGGAAYLGDRPEQQRLDTLPGMAGAPFDDVGPRRTGEVHRRLVTGRAGSTPLAREELDHVAVVVEQPGPTRSREVTPCRDRPVAGCLDQPRSCGEGDSLRTATATATGPPAAMTCSPPRSSPDNGWVLARSGGRRPVRGDQGSCRGVPGVDDRYPLRVHRVEQAQGRAAVHMADGRRGGHRPLADGTRQATRSAEEARPGHPRRRHEEGLGTCKGKDFVQPRDETIIRLYCNTDARLFEVGSLTLDPESAVTAVLHGTTTVGGASLSVPAAAGGSPTGATETPVE